jgi:hypothetical protein
MGLLITNQISTDACVTSEAYVNIQSIKITKGQNISVSTNIYASLADKLENPENTVISRSVYGTISFSPIGSPNELEDVAIYELAYFKLKEALISSGLTVEDSF